MPYRTRFSKITYILVSLGYICNPVTPANLTKSSPQIMESVLWYCRDCKTDL